MVVATVLAVSQATCSSDDMTGAHASAGPQTPPSAAGSATALTPEMVAPFFDGDPVARAAAERFALEDWSGARDGFRAYLAETREPPLSERQQARARLLIAECDARLSAWAPAAAGFEQALAQFPKLADYLHYQAARGFYFAHDSERAMTHARKVAPKSITGADAAMLVGDLLRGDELWDQVAAHYRGYLDGGVHRTRRAEARYRLAQALDQRTQIGEALTHYRTLTIHVPLSSWGQKAQERIDALLPTQPESENARIRSMNASEYIARGMAYFDAMRNPLSEADFAAALSTSDITPSEHCVAAFHRAQSVFKARDRKRAAPLFDEAIAACASAHNLDLQVKSAYQAGRSYAFEGQHQIAIARYQQAETIDPSHTYVDDARLRQAEEYTSLDDQDTVTLLLASIPEKYPEGDMRAEALWRLGWRAFSEARYEEAVGWLQKQIDTMPIDPNWWAEGQAQYWQGRALAELGRADDSIASYRAAVLRYPLSYYALLALNRLRENHPEAFANLRAELTQVPAREGEEAEAGAFHFRPRPVYQTPGFERALTFLRLGLGTPAEAELRRIGLELPSGREPVTDPDRADKAWATVFLYDRAGNYALSHWPTRYNLVEYKRSWPAGANAERWKIAYPRAYWDLIHKHASANGFPGELLMGIVREESAFSPLLESYANAVGLTQLIFPTARRFAQGTGIEVSRETLRDPEKNVTIGARFLSFLWTKWNGYVPLIPPSYNAGEGAVARWLRARGELPADAWVESIPADQPRGYTKRVLSSYFTYTYLYRGEIPAIANVISEPIRQEAR